MVNLNVLITWTTRIHWFAGSYKNNLTLISIEMVFFFKPMATTVSSGVLVKLHRSIFISLIWKCVTMQTHQKFKLEYFAVSSFINEKKDMRKSNLVQLK